MARFRIASVIALWLATVVGAEATSIALVPGTQVVSPGSVVSLDLVASGLGAVLGDYDLDVSFDPAVLTLDTFVVSAALGSVAAGDALDFSLGLTSPGILNLSIVSLLSAAQLGGLQGASFSLATLGFSVGNLAPGASTLVEIAVNALGDDRGSAIPVDSLQNASLNAPALPTEVPEPSTAVLCLSALSAWLWSRAARRKNG